MTSGRAVVLGALLVMASISAVGSQTPGGSAASPTGLMMGRVVEPSSIRVTLGEGEKKTQDLKLGGG